MKLAVAALGASLALAGCATGPYAARPAGHHPPGAAAAAPGQPTPGQTEAMLKSMQEMHDRMAAARTPDERAALMREHMKVMQDGMAMMGRMRGGMMGGQGRMPMDADAMQRRMDMMEMMMQMMMDREGMRPPPAR